MKEGLLKKRFEYQWGNVVPVSKNSRHPGEGRDDDIDCCALAHHTTQFVFNLRNAVSWLDGPRENRIARRTNRV